MATADELLSSLPETSEILRADLDSRVISIPASLQVLGVESDDDVKRLHFNVPRYYREIDLSKFKFNINFENARHDGDLWPVDDLSINDDDTLSFSWLVDRTAFQSAGKVTFSICMKLYDENGVVVKELNTTTATLTVLPGLETSKSVVNNNPGVLDKLFFRLYAVEAATDLITDNIQQQIESLYIDKTVTDKVVTVNDAIPANLKDVTVNDGTEVTAVKVVGRNLFNCNNTASKSNIGVTWYYDKDTQEFVINGTTSAAGDMKLIDPYTVDWVAGEKYTVSVLHTGGTATLATGSASTTYAFGIFSSNASKFIRGVTSNTEFKEIYNFTSTAFEATSYIFYLQCWRPGTVFNNYRIKIQVERGEIMHDWEPYKEISATLDTVQTLTLKYGYNNILTSPLANITVSYVVKTKTYVDGLFYGKTAWENKKWYAFGTSITDTGYINEETGTPTGKYVPYLAEMSGLKVINKGLAGGTIGKGGDYGGSANILNRILTTDLSDADLITIEGFVNDFACSVPIGELGDTGGTDPIADTEQITICGALYRAVKHCQETAPNALVILLTESTGTKYTLKNGQTGDYRFDRKKENGLFQKDYNDAIIKMGQFIGVRVIDAGSKSQINYFNPQYIIDQIHHTELGGKRYAAVIWDELKNISPISRD